MAGCAIGQDGDRNGQQYRDLLVDISGLLIPATDTPGADALFIWSADIALNAIYVGMDNATYAMVARVRDSLNGATGGDYLSASVEKRYRAIETLDASAYASPPQGGSVEAAWRKVKALLLLGYYTSQAGASKELTYALVPGRYDPDIPLTPDMRAISSDWFAVSFR